MPRPTIAAALCAAPFLGCDGVVHEGLIETWPELAYASLAAYLDELAERFESGAYYVTDEGALERDEEKHHAIFRRRHPGLADEAPPEVEVSRSESIDDAGARTVTIQQSGPLTRVERYDAAGRRRRVELRRVEGYTAMAWDDAYDPEGRLVERRYGTDGNHFRWDYGDGDRVTIRKRYRPDYAETVEARIADGRWRVESITVERP